MLYILHILKSIFVGIVTVSQLAFSPLAAIRPSMLADVEQAFTQNRPTTQPLIDSLYNLGSPTRLGSRIYTSGFGASWETESAIYAIDQVDEGWSSPKKLIAVPQMHVSDPTIVAPSAEALLMYTTEISTADAEASTTLVLRNHIGLWQSIDGGQIWRSLGIVVPQQNGIDTRGGWAPSAILSSSGQEIWVYYTTNGPGVASVYRSRFDLSGQQLLGTDALVYSDGKPLSVFNVDVSRNQNGQFVMYANANLSTIMEFTSSDGLLWQSPTNTTNPVITAAPGATIGAPTFSTGTAAVYFASGALSDSRWTSLQFAYPSDFPAYQAMAPEATGQGSGSTENTSGSSGGGSAMGIALLGIAGAVGLGYLASTISIAAPVVAGAATQTVLKSFGGRIIGIKFGLAGCINFTILPAGAFPIDYVWLPGTITYLAGPPTHIGQQVLGLANPVPIPCVGFGAHPPIWYGLRVHLMGSSQS